MPDQQTYRGLDEDQLSDLVPDLENKGFELTAKRNAGDVFSLTAKSGRKTPRGAKLPADTAAALAAMRTPLRRPIPDFEGSGDGITEADFERAAAELDCDVAAIKAVSEVESRGGGYLSRTDPRPKILFEAHIFGRRTNHVFNASHPAISSRKWNRSLYSGGAGEYDRLEAALRLDRNAALASASWGRFQIMGFNFQVSGFSSVTAFVSAMVESEGRQLDAFVGFIKGNRLDDELRAHDWAAFASRYNGPAYAENKYDEKMQRAWEKHAAGTWLSPREVQAALNRAGADPRLKVDGAIGRKSRRAIKDFQEANGLTVDGQVTPELIGALLKV